MTTPQDHVRLFVACDVRWIRPEGIHVTLKFLGEVPIKKLPAIKLAIQEAVVGHAPFELEFSNIGTFGGREGLRIMWVGIAGDVLRLEALVRAVNAALKVVGFEPERRPFRPHLTLGRVRDEIGTRRRAQIEVDVGKTGVPPSTWRTAQVSLMRSRLTAQGAMYDVLATFPLRVTAPATL
jgi:2'-5' RNA ligase